MTARERAAETLAITGFFTLAAVAVYALAVLTPWWQFMLAVVASSSAMTGGAER